MKPVVLAAGILACSLRLAFAAEAPEEETVSPEADVEIGPRDEGTLSPDLGSFCIIAGTPPSDSPYSVLRRLKVGKGTYGGIRDILPKLASNAKRRGADALIDYDGAQRFGFHPWRMVRPVVRGTAIRWTGSKPESCTAAGGHTLRDILESGLSPDAMRGVKEGS